jgi:hypothetical protein
MPGQYTRRDIVRGGAALGFAVAFGETRINTQTHTDQPQPADLILFRGHLATLDERRPSATTAAIKDGRFVAVGMDAEVMAYRGEQTQVIDVGNRTVIPGLNDSHMHPIRGGLNYTLELRWDGVPSVAEALRMLQEQARRTPPPQWVRVVGGWAAFQFAERRMPTLKEINAVSPETPVFVLHLYDRALLNQAARRAGRCNATGTAIRRAC